MPIALGSASVTFAHELGLQLYSVRKQMDEDLPKAFSQINQWGIKIVEGGGALYGHSVEEYRNQLIKNDLQIVSVDASFEELRDNPIAVVYKARYFGSRFATFYWIPHDNAKGFDLADAKGAIEVMNKAGKLLKENGITLQYHAHGYEFLPHGNGTLLDYMLENVKHAAFQMDVFWMKQGGMDPTKLLQKYPGRFLSLHLKDRKIGTKNSTNGRADVEANVVLGTGDVGISSVIAEAKKQGIRYFFIEDESSRILTQVPQSIQYLKSLD
ncbi:MAG: sugar phosphate isomerase/epimerase [Paraglaciecola sp.]|nr:sugar phosphate isomerase/epimerase [Paraglaciecola sp.]